MEILACSYPQIPATQSPKSFPYDGETLWMPLALGDEALLQGLRQRPQPFCPVLWKRRGWLAPSQVRTPAKSGLHPHPTAFLPICLPPSMQPGPLSENVDHLPRVSGLTDERKFPGRGNSLSRCLTQFHL